MERNKKQKTCNWNEQDEDHIGPKILQLMIFVFRELWSSFNAEYSREIIAEKKKVMFSLKIFSSLSFICYAFHPLKSMRS